MKKREKKRWSDMTTPQRVVMVVGAVIQLTLLSAALWDIRRRPAEEIRGSKPAWTAVSFVNFVGPISYFLFGRKRHETSP